MPSKGHRAASRQAKVRQKKRRGKGGAQVLDTGPTQAEATTEAQTAGSDVERAPAAPAPSPAAAAAPRPRRRSRQTAGGEALRTYPYLGMELRQIGLTSLVIFILLAVLTFLLGG